MYVCTCIGGKRQYVPSPISSWGRQQYLADVIMDEQSKELGGDRHETEKNAGTKAVGFLAASRPSVSKSVSEKRAVGHATMRDGEI
jgi:hypothetical protein